MSRASGIDARARVDTLDGATMQPIVGAMSAVENGVAACAADVCSGWAMFAEEYI